MPSASAEIPIAKKKIAKGLRLLENFLVDADIVPFKPNREAEKVWLDAE
jgi:hypothetical protein